MNPSGGWCIVMLTPWFTVSAWSNWQPSLAADSGCQPTEDQSSAPSLYGLGMRSLYTAMHDWSRYYGAIALNIACGAVIICPRFLRHAEARGASRVGGC